MLSPRKTTRERAGSAASCDPSARRTGSRDDGAPASPIRYSRVSMSPMAGAGSAAGDGVAQAETSDAAVPTTHASAQRAKVRLDRFIRTLSAIAPAAVHRGDILGHGRAAEAHEPTGREHEPVPAAARPQPRGLASLGRGGPRPVSRGGQADPPQHRVLRLPLVPRDGARVLRGRGHRRAHERAFRAREGGPRGAPRHRRHLHGGDPGHEPRPRRVADDGLPHPRSGAVLRRHVFPARRRARPPRLPHPSPAHRRPVGEGQGGAARAGRGARPLPAREHARRRRGRRWESRP